MPTAPPTFKPAWAPARKQQTAFYDRRRGSASARGYDRDWQKLRAMFLRNHPLCADCLEANRATPSIEVHHVQDIAKGGPRLDEANLLALCKACHSRRTAASQGLAAQPQGPQGGGEGSKLKVDSL